MNDVDNMTNEISKENKPFQPIAPTYRHLHLQLSDLCNVSLFLLNIISVNFRFTLEKYKFCL